MVCNRQEGEKYKLTLRGSNVNVFDFESKIYEIENEDEEVVNSNGPIFHFIFKDVHRSLSLFSFLRSQFLGLGPQFIIRRVYILLIEK